MLKEYKRFKDIKFEIQIRSILQHAWAEIEHDLGYKGVDSVPDSFKRNFSMIAALLEMADRDFVNLRSESNSYKTEINTIIKNNPEEVDINKDSLEAYIYNGIIITELNKELNDNLGIQFISSTDGLIHHYLKILNFFKIQTISRLNDLIVQNRNAIIEFIKDWSEKNAISGQKLVKGASIIYLGYILIGKEGNSALEKYLDYLDIKGNDDEKREFFEQVANTLNNIK